MRWPVVALDQCTRIVGGATPSTNVPDFWDGEIGWATPKDLSDLEGNHLNCTARKITDGGLASCAAEVLPAGSVLFSSRAPIGLVAINDVPLATNQGFKSFVPDRKRLDAGYLLWWLNANRLRLENLGNGATFKELSKAAVARIEIPLPSLAEQKHIALVLDQADGLRRKRQRSLELLDRLLHSHFFEVFGDPRVNSMQWPKRPLGDLVTKLTDGEHLNPKFTEDGMPIIMAGNVADDHIDLGRAKRVNVEDAKRFRKKCRPERGDLLIVSRGATIGRLCYVHTSEAFCLMGSVILIKPDAHVLDGAYLSTLLKHPLMRSHLYNTSGSSAQQAIYLKDLKHLTCPVPPLPLQRKFGERVIEIDRLKGFFRLHLAKLDSLFVSLQHRAFRGELNPKDAERQLAIAS